MTDPERDARLARDAAHRARALDTTTSFLVQAPAGSGKTELLIQRYLALLARVDSPQRVVAMTFTRKAAAEMRERVVEALAAARDNVPVTSAHRRTTRDLAVAVLAQAERRGWALLAYPAQLSIFTIDALSAMLARQAPVTSSMGAAPRIVERAEALYAEAARETLADADPTDAAWRHLLAYLDNNAQRVVQLLASMLGKREQWLPHVMSRDESALRAHVEEVLRAELTAELGAARARIDDALLASIARCAGRAAEVLRAEGSDPTLAEALELCVAHGGMPRAHHEDVAGWRGVIGWLLTKQGDVRRTMNIRQGIRAGPLGAQHKADALAMLGELVETPEAVTALHRASRLPDANFTERDWRIVAALLHVLPQAAAHLAVTFARRGAVDFAELNAAAARALGAADAPSELMLRLDLSIEHLLVDEFQDTSDAQYRLIGMLTSGWQPGDGRTLFAVGDPMQSIYRFRDAEVRLFLTAIDEGRIGHVPVSFIDLTRNFRSQGALVGWVNRVFPAILGARNEPWRSAVAFAAAAATHPEGAQGPPTLDVVESREEEAARVVAHVRAALDAGISEPSADAGEGDVAILVRARSDLELILPALRDAGIAFAAVELDALAARQAVQDVVALAHALMQPADRLATLSVLRAPWCGLVLADLLAVAPHARDGLAHLLPLLPGLEGVSDDGRRRLARIAPILGAALAAHGHAAFADRVRGTWLALGGPATIEEAVDFGAVEDFFALLRAHAAGSDVDDWQAVRDELEARFVTSAEEAITRVKVMTLFKAKGLEFDTVIIPGLARPTPADDRELLQWRARPRGLLLAAPGHGGHASPVHEYMAWLASTEADHELGRMLYVGVTRARRRLHLVAAGSVRVDATTGAASWVTPRSASALGKLWKVLRDEVAPPAIAANDAAVDTDRVAPPLVRLPVDFALPALAPAVPALRRQAPRDDTPVFEWARADAAIVGTVTHRHLARRAVDPALWRDDASRAALVARLRSELAAEGMAGAALDTASADVVAILEAVEADARGRWLFDPAHEDARSEWPLAGVDGGGVVHVTIDRSFVADGVRWIVDFKTGHHEGADAAAFLAQEEARYRAQLERYARIVRALDARPIRLALYYPRVAGGWREWSFEPAGTQATLF